MDDYARAEKAISGRNFREADFRLTKILSREPGRDLKELLKKRALPPPSLLSPEYDSAFTDWFFEASRSLWSLSDNKIKEDHKTYELRFVREGRYFAAIAASPRLEQWSVSKPGAPVNVISTGDPAAKVTLLSNYPTVYLETGRHALQYVWMPQFKDIDGDKVPEIFIRYNLTWGNGFRQYLAVYKINNDIKLQLFWKFEGQSEGVAKLLPDGRVMTASGGASQPSLSHMSYDLWKAEYWTFDGHEYKKTEEKSFPHPLKSRDWQNFV
jgi:hypothetical protein